MKTKFAFELVKQVAGLIACAARYDKAGIDKDSYDSAVCYRLPFAGSWAVVNGGPDEEFSHSWDIYPQRYAYDFVILDEALKTFSGDEFDLKSYYCYGKDVLAPADGVVVDVVDGFPDCQIIGSGQTDPESPDIGGNRITVKHAENEYSTVCHLIPRSIRPKIGQAVQQGEIIARCGNSGNTTEPHIHFQLQNTPKFYSSHGLPIRFAHVESAFINGFEAIGPRPAPSPETMDARYLYRGMRVSHVDQ